LKKWCEIRENVGNVSELNSLGRESLVFKILTSLGIPTKQGYKFISIQDIIKCKREKNYTRISLQQEKTIISDTNIGELLNKLSPFGFYSPHKSHIINLQQIRKYSKEGLIILKDGSEVPLAGGQKSNFFKNILLL